MPPKIKELIKMLESAGFKDRGGKGSHRNYKHPSGINITISGKLSSDAKRYQERDVRKAIERVLNEEKK
jgi:predicted RNA binding protein YcfA (HicA-like mRNA interferase family)